MKTIQWSVEKGQNGTDDHWLWCRIDGGQSWALFIWDYKPTEAEIKEQTETFYRAFVFYHMQLTVPEFGNPEVEIKVGGRIMGTEVGTGIV